MIPKKTKALIGLAMSISIIFIGLTSCAQIQGENYRQDLNTSINYKVTDEVKEEASKIKMPNMPTSPFWFPEELLAWDPSKDENIEFNKGTVPLAKRLSKGYLDLVNETQDKDFSVVALSIMNASTSGNPSQGSNKFDSNTFSYWQYIDKLVYWGGSAGEGIIVPPSADVIDSAHKNGVPVLGTIFFPTTEHGGKAEWVDQFLQKDENGKFPMIDKLIEVCEVLGFDGWFINMETGLTVSQNDFIDQTETAQEGAKITEEHAKLMQEFIKEFNERSDLEIMWYDSLTKDGKMDWQNALTEKNDYFLIDSDQKEVANSMFLNFWWTTDRLADQELLKKSRERAISLGLNPHELYAGIDMQANGTNTPIKWDLLVDENDIPYTSLGLYCPSWTFFSSDNVDDFLSKEERLWVNEFGDPSKKSELTGDSFRGISTYAVENTVLTSLPFSTNFNMGNGYNYFIKGEKVSSMDWNNRSLADVMPTYRWIIKNNENNLKGSIDYSNAYYGGNSIRFSGSMKQNTSSIIKLFSSGFELTKNTKFTTTAISDNADINLNLILQFDDGTSEEILGDKKVANTWTTVGFDVSKFAGKIVKSISYKISSDSELPNAGINFGNITITNEDKLKLSNITNVDAYDVVFDEDGEYAGIRLSFDSTNKENIDHYEIYKINKNGFKSFLGASITDSYFINALPRDNEYRTTIEVVAVNKNLEKGESSTTQITWPDNSNPRANFEASKTLISPGEEITFNSLSSQTTKDLEWTFEGANIEKSTDPSPTVTYANEGTYTVTLKAKNESGEDTKVLEGYITVTNSAKDNVTNLSLNKSAEATSFVNANEAPQLAFDGATDTKWCATGTPPHSITVDLGTNALISGVNIAHAEAGGESPDMNTSDYTIEVSEDGVNFTEVVNVKKNSKANTSDSFKAVNARYVRLNVVKPTQGSDSAARIYEIEVMGIQQ